MSIVAMRPALDDQCLIVSDVRAVDLRWIRTLLARCGVADIACDVRAEALGSGLSGSSYRLLIEYAGEPQTAAPRSLYLKLPSAVAQVRAALATGYEMEMLCYRRIIPALGILVPACWLAAFDPVSSGFTLALNDAHPAAGGDQLAGVPPARLGQAITQLAIMHAKHWNGVGLEDARGWLTPFYSRSFTAPPGVAAAWARALTRYAGCWSAEELAFGAWFVAHYADWRDQMPSLHTFVHADYRLENLLLDSNGELVGVVDWQSAAIAPGAIDLAYLVAGSLSFDARRSTERALVADYQRELASRGVSGYCFTNCWRDYRYGSLHGLMLILLASFSITGEGYSHELFLTLLKRHLRHAMDMRVDELVS